ncbi:MAG: hypothetical protein AAFM91_05335 [Pseudomonadota bacterium]
MMLSLAAVGLVALGAWFGLIRRPYVAALFVLIALAPLLLLTAITKAIFIWLALIGPVIGLAVVLKGLKTRNA